jgi:hypothetical protein
VCEKEQVWLEKKWRKFLAKARKRIDSVLKVVYILQNTKGPEVIHNCGRNYFG